MSKRCEHPSGWTQVVESYVDGHIMSRTWCSNCREYIPLGSASDTEATAVEVRAAEIAADWERFCEGWHGFTSLGSCSDLDQTLGMVAACERDIADGRTPQQRAQDIADLWAGYLANVIAAHTSGTEEM